MPHSDAASQVDLTQQSPQQMRFTFEYNGEPLEYNVKSYTNDESNLLQPLSAVDPRTTANYHPDGTQPSVNLFETATASRRFHHSTHLYKRWKHALALGCTGVQRDYKVMDTRKAAARKIIEENQQHWVFELETLNELLQGCRHSFVASNETMFSLDGHLYSQLSQSMTMKRHRLGKKLGSNTPITACPTWGDNEHNYEHLYTANDFEILAVLYRAEVETFILEWCFLFANVSNTPSVPASNASPPVTPQLIAPERQSRSVRISPQHLDSTRSTPSKAPPTMSTTRHSPPLSQPSFLGKGHRSPPDVSQLTSATRLKELIGSPFHGKKVSQQSDSDFGDSQDDNWKPPPFKVPNPFANNNPGDPGSGGSSDSDADGNKGPPKRASTPFPSFGNSNLVRPTTADHTVKEPHFDLKLKPSDVPTWDGDDETLLEWIDEVNNLAKRSKRVHQELGKVIPLRLRDGAQKYWFSLPDVDKEKGQRNWDEMRNIITSYYMNMTWFARNRHKAERCYYREPGNEKESPSEYYIRKTTFLNLISDHPAMEMIQLVMAGAPFEWDNILHPFDYSDLVSFQKAIKLNEESLKRYKEARCPQYKEDHPRRSEPTMSSVYRPSGRKFETHPKFQSNGRKKGSATLRKGRAFAIGYSPSLEFPKYPPDNATISRGKTPEDVGARGCRHCSSGKHWDNDCKYKPKKFSKAKANAVSHQEEDSQDEYEELYRASVSCGDPESEPDPEEDVSEGSDSSPELSHLDSEGVQVTAHANAVSRRQMQRKMERLLKPVKKKAMANTVAKFPDTSNDTRLVILKQFMSRPPGTTYLGSEPSIVTVNLMKEHTNEVSAVLDSGADITLISDQILKAMQPRPKTKHGRRIKLIQVTGNTDVTGYVTLPIIFKTSQGPVLMQIDAYVVANMEQDLIIGNDFADQYALSIIRKDGMSHLQLGDSGRLVFIRSSTSLAPTNKDGHLYNIKSVTKVKQLYDKFSLHRKEKSRKRKLLELQKWAIVSEPACLQPGHIGPVKVNVTYPEGQDQVYIEKVMNFRRTPEECFGPSDCLLSSKVPQHVLVSNFASEPVYLEIGERIGKVHNPTKWLDSKDTEQPPSNLAKANLIRALAKCLDQPIHDDSSSQSSETVTPEDFPRGPKTAEIGEEETASVDLLTEVDINPKLDEDKRSLLEKVVIKFKNAFSLDGRLGRYPAKVAISLKEGTQPVTLPPFNASPTNRKVIDEQMDAWLKLGAIEESKSPWGAPAFIVYRNKKPRMVIDFRKLNDSVIPDEHPIPKQESVIQALEGSQYLSTFDALSGFTQLEMDEGSKELTGFRTHRGLYQFKRLPLGFRNGPAVFQRVMNKVLAPYLWKFALVYIDDIIVFSTTFEDHAKQIGEVLEAIAESGITLSPKKCHIGYQSLMLLGQKVSRLGMSTHREKIDSIVQLDKPRNVSEVRTFLGMMTYFSSYIPFYAWIVAPLFRLLKKKQLWKWGPEEQKSFDTAKTVLTHAPVRAYAISEQKELIMRLYTDACDEGIAAILQQVQPIRIGDLKGTRTYDRLEKAYQEGESVPSLVVPFDKVNSDVPQCNTWDARFEDTIVHIERVIAYWSRILKPAERNYSTTEREALALKEGLVKFQVFLEGRPFQAITDHSALQWSKTYQNVNKRLTGWGTTFSAYPEMKIIHRPGRVHSNVDPLSRYLRMIPKQEGPVEDPQEEIRLKPDLDPLAIYNQLHQAITGEATLDADISGSPDLASAQTTESKVEICPEPERATCLSYQTAQQHSLIIGVSHEELSAWVKAYKEDSHFATILEELSRPRTDTEPIPPQYDRYQLSPEGLLYFTDAIGNFRLCVPKAKQVSLMGDTHNLLTEGAHSGYHRTYNRIAALYFWPRMSRDIKEYVVTCDICQKVKPRRYSPLGLLQPIPIPSQPFEVISMDFIPELPKTEKGFDNVLVIVDKLTKYGIFIPTATNVGEVETAHLIFKHVISVYGLPLQIISDRDSRWSNTFWKEMCDLMGSKRSLTTAYHPQADGQTEILNQTLEIALRAYVGPMLDDWDLFLNGFSLSYNSTPHSATSFAPAYLLYGFVPRTIGTLIASNAGEGEKRNAGDNKRLMTSNGEEAELSNRTVPNGREARKQVASNDQNDLSNKEALDFDPKNRDLEAQDLVRFFQAIRSQARDALAFSQEKQIKYFNQNKRTHVFREGEKVLINPHSLHLLRDLKGRGRKLSAKFEGPFEVSQRLGINTYRLRIPASYRIHPVINVSHLDPYRTDSFDDPSRPSRELNRDDFDVMEEFEVERILKERKIKRGRRRVTEYFVRWKGYTADSDEWVSQRNIRNAPLVLLAWKNMSEKKKEEANEGRQD